MRTLVQLAKERLVLSLVLVLVLLVGIGRGDVLAVKDALPPSGRIRSSGTTPVPIYAGTAGKTTVLAGAVVLNGDTIGHTIDLLSSGGSLLREFTLAPASSFPNAVFDEGQNIQSLLGEGISMSIDAAGVTTSVTCTAQASVR